LALEFRILFEHAEYTVCVAGTYRGRELLPRPQGKRFHVLFELGPTCKPVVAGYDMLCVSEFRVRRCRLQGQRLETLQGSGYTLPEILQEFLGLFLEVFEIGSCG